MFAWTRPCAAAVWAAALLAVAVSSLPARAASRAEQEPFAATGIRAALLLPRIAIDGDFDGRRIHVQKDQVLQVPEIDPAFGIGLSVGRRGRRYSLELNYQRSSHDAVLPSGASGEATFSSFNLDLRYYFLAHRRLQPYVLVGWVPFARLIVSNASGTVAGAAGTGEFRAEMTGFNLGAGLEWFATRRISVGGAAFYRRIVFETGKGVGGESFLIKDAGHGFNAMTTVSYCYGDF